MEPFVHTLTDDEVADIRERAAEIRERYGLTPDEPFAKECECCPVVDMAWEDFDYLRIQSWLVEGL